MLVLSRKAGQRIVISEEITITVLEVLGSRVRIGVEAPASVVIRRSELAAWPPIRVVNENGQVATSKVENVVLSQVG
ncbi:MAG: carbon storage regulator [Planctomycetales bacterium]|nr:carbon storage regulator [Planctomycetales bacterium]